MMKFYVNNHIDAYLTEQHMKHFINFSGDWKEPWHFYYDNKQMRALG